MNSQILNNTEMKLEMIMKIAFAAFALALALAGSVQASTVSNGGLPSWAEKAFERTH